MKIVDVRTGLSNLLSPLFREHGFTDRKCDCDFVRHAGEFIYFFHVQVYAKTGWFFSKPAVSVGFPVINKLRNQILPSKEPVKINGPTVGLCFGISNEYHGRGDYNIETVDDIEVAATGIKEDFAEIALPYYEKMHDLNSVERCLNKNNLDGTYLPTTVSAACMGLIAAHLCGRTDFKSLADFYYNYHYNFPYTWPSPQKRQSMAAPILTVKNYFEKSEKNTNDTVVRGLLPPAKKAGSCTYRG